MEAATTPKHSAVTSPVPVQTDPATPSWSSSSSSGSIPSDEGDSLISRLCGRQWKLNSDEEGQFKFFGPTSSLHLTESVSSTLLGTGYRRSSSEDTIFDFPIDEQTHLHLLELYWNHQHTILQVFDREEFLEGMRTKSNKYFSKALLYAIYCCAARISDRLDIRAMVIPAQDDVEDDLPFLVATATALLERELQRPQITTIQALLLMSVIYCSLSKDTKGWLLTGKSIIHLVLRPLRFLGDACRLAIDLGLHKPGEMLASAKLSPRDIKARQITYWGCLVFDR